MMQTIIGLIVIAYFIGRLFWQKRAAAISGKEFKFWLFFWSGAAVLLLSLKQLDQMAAQLGFSASGIELLLYLAVAGLFYFIFRIRLRLEKMEKHITTIVGQLSKK